MLHLLLTPQNRGVDNQSGWSAVAQCQAQFANGKFVTQILVEHPPEIQDIYRSIHFPILGIQVLES